MVVAAAAAVVVVMPSKTRKISRGGRRRGPDAVLCLGLDGGKLLLRDMLEPLC